MPRLIALAATLALLAGAGAVAAADLAPGSPELSLPKEGCEFPDFPLQEPTGATVWFRDFQGKVLLVSFCSCYTDACCAIIDALEAIRREFGAEILSLVVCSEIAPALAEKQLEGIRSQCADAADRVLLDEQGQGRAFFAVTALPTVFLVDGSFCLRGTALTVAEASAPAFRDRIRRVLEERRAKAP